MFGLDRLLLSLVLTVESHTYFVGDLVLLIDKVFPFLAQVLDCDLELREDILVILLTALSLVLYEIPFV
jgi:hypothetical protein